MQSAGLGSLSESTVDVPSQVGADELAVIGIFDGLEADNAPPLEGGQVLVASWDGLPPV